MNELLALTHAAALGLGVLGASIFFELKMKQGAKNMASNKFVSILKDIGTGLKKFFTSPVAAEIETDGIDLAEIAWPAFTPFLNGLKTSIATAQTLAAAANTTGDTTAQVTALALADAQQVFNAYQTATGTAIETAQQEKIIQAFINLIDQVPSPASAPAPAPTPVAAVAPAPTPLQQAIASLIAPTASGTAPAPGPSLVANVVLQRGPGLDNVTAQ